MLPAGKNTPSDPPGRILTAASGFPTQHPASQIRAVIRRIHAASRHTHPVKDPLSSSAGMRRIGEVRILEKCGILIARKNLAAQGFFFLPSLREPLKLRGIPF